ncbi:CBS domain-containing protein [bacterium]|nr:CBS domain-containing protein [bacterium]
MRVRDLMQQPVVSLDESAEIDLADGLMRMDRIRHLPVLSSDRLVGIVSQRDLFRAGVERSLGRADEGPPSPSLLLRDVMNREVVTAHPDADLASAVEMLLQRRIGCLPVVEDGRLVGLLSETDCLRHLATLLESRA